MTPSFGFIICINLSKRLHKETFHGTFLLGEGQQASEQGPLSLAAQDAHQSSEENPGVLGHSRSPARKL